MFANHQLLSFQIAAVKVAAILVLDLIGVTLFLSAAFRSELFAVRFLLWPFTTFIHKARLFVISQTYGNALGPITIPEWDAERTLKKTGTLSKAGRELVLNIWATID